MSLTLHRSIQTGSGVTLAPKTAGAGSAGSPTRLSLVDRDLFFRYRPVLAANGAPTPSARHQLNLAAIWR